MLGSGFENIDLLQKGLYAATVRNNVIANNIANVNTPNFKRSEVKFENILKDAINGTKLRGYITNPKHIPIGPPPVDSIQPEIVQVNNTSMRLDGNNVDIDAEMANLAKNQLYYYALVQRVSGELNSIMTAVKDGR
ncbi:flagellar basal-body rod protein FlgB [Thermoanaerobacter mathranii subsp. mathranii str. A3]|jgi:flagellar basal-body rod protein FlgB|uniref:Flagellar basal body rod protein FlgB n=3 Tax=Thermoanaerobacter TaxID=1754 RepID=D3T2Q0_THEIA|nr:MULTISPECIES: flagellar basal body rod protein FlgB [Thermoanaerobacter]ADD02502.1 flagellar basal-body rod protein FlgB [Thermoanaerobacter italicus Ab9]ADH61004.1 flagellar basal-body rod protein FlgB [Thermoanaerobacter mathranii subsp. mathranii str. A3]MDP9749957.1 flagellar basal-body rod protein FlgB [Thermoanaerobacter pentosaceus]